MKVGERDNVELYVVVFAAVAVFSCLAGFVVYFIVLYKNKQLKNLQEQAELRASFRQEMLKAKLEVQEQTLNNVSREIHDNITQVLSFIKLNLAMIVRTEQGEKAEKLNESRELVAQVINDLRDLSKSMSFEHITQMGLVRTLEKEADRINKSGLLQVEFSAGGEIYPLGEQRELVLFRIFQEALNNTLKYADATNLKIGLHYHPDLFNLTIEDDGSGFSARVQAIFITYQSCTDTIDSRCF